MPKTKLTDAQQDIYYRFNGAKPIPYTAGLIVEDKPYLLNTNHLLKPEALTNIQAALAYKGPSYYSGYGDSKGIVHLLRRYEDKTAYKILGYVYEQNGPGAFEDFIATEILSDKETCAELHSHYNKRELPTKKTDPNDVAGQLAKLVDAEFEPRLIEMKLIITELDKSHNHTAHNNAANSVGEKTNTHTPA